MTKNTHTLVQLKSLYVLFAGLLDVANQIGSKFNPELPQLVFDSYTGHFEKEKCGG